MFFFTTKQQLLARDKLAQDNEFKDSSMKEQFTKRISWHEIKNCNFFLTLDHNHSTVQSVQVK